MTFLASFIQYLVSMIVLAAIGILGGILGKKLRDRKDAKDAAIAQTEGNQSIEDK